ncbi:MAG: gamma-glutamylcyclotransferase [Alphaproteobacteria bacterium]|nr:gamma-glutamylcyclotransferase [Alphaproteobacteria bacterium]
MTNKLSRESIRDGHVYRMLREQQHITNIRPLTDAERGAAMDRFLAHAPEGPVWVFGYGSLIWNPAFHHAGRETARIWGLHRAFCLKTPLGRGSVETPGLVLALDNGGSCNGVAYRLPDDAVREELKLVWDREMALDSYRAVWVRAHTPEGPVNAVTFAINRASERYAGDLSEAEQVRLLATASGYLGSCREYLDNTVAHLRECGVGDAYLFRLQKLVETYAADG